MSVIATEFEFNLPIGYRDGEGTLHRQGVMRLATAADEILPLRDHRVQSNPAYLSIILLSRVIVKLGTLDMINTREIEGLFSADFAFLQQFYNKINQLGQVEEAKEGGDSQPGKSDLLASRTRPM